MFTYCFIWKRNSISLSRFTIFTFHDYVVSEL
jgi:hypothetical protein